MTPIDLSQFYFHFKKRVSKCTNLQKHVDIRFFNFFYTYFPKPSFLLKLIFNNIRRNALFILYETYCFRSKS